MKTRNENSRLTLGIKDGTHLLTQEDITKYFLMNNKMILYTLM